MADRFAINSRAGKYIFLPRKRMVLSNKNKTREMGGGEKRKGGKIKRKNKP